MSQNDKAAEVRQAILNLPASPVGGYEEGLSPRAGYLCGHREARTAAAELFDLVQAASAEREKALTEELTWMTNDRDEWKESTVMANARFKRAEEEVARLREALARMTGHVRNLVAFDQMSTEYDGKMLHFCPSCDKENDTHAADCDFVLARADIPAEPLVKVVVKRPSPWKRVQCPHCEATPREPGLQQHINAVHSALQTTGAPA